MWTIIKIDKKKLNLLKQDFQKKIEGNFIFYNPKLRVQKLKKNKLVNKEIDILENYVFCFNKNFDKESTLNNLKFCRGFNYFLSGFKQSQSEIEYFINKCKSFEDKYGYLSNSFFLQKVNNTYKFLSGPFTNKIFKIIALRKNKIDVLMGNLKSTINRKDFLFKPI
jgi:hypothetical protein